MSGPGPPGVPRLDLAAVPWKATRHPGLWIHFLSSDRATGHAAVLVRMAPGAAYPAHRHAGPEELLLLQGEYEDDRGRHRAPSYLRYEEGTSHHPRCPPDAAGDCVFFAVAQRGIELLA